MKNVIKPLVYSFFFLVCYAGFSQDKLFVLKGKVRSLSNDVSDVLVVNLNSKESTITNVDGLFTLEVQLNDSIQFSALQYRTKEIIITSSLLNWEIVHVDLLTNIVALDEVTVMPYNLTGRIDQDVEGLQLKPRVSASSLDLLNAGVKRLSYSERLLLVADRGNFTRFMSPEEMLNAEISIHQFLKIGVVLNTDKMFNRFTGNTKTYKAMVIHDKEKDLESRLLDMFSKKTLTESLEIPDNRLEAFLSFCFAQSGFIELLENKNAFEIWEHLEVKNKEYKEAHAIELKDKTH